MWQLEHTCDLKRAVPVGTNGRSQVQTLYTGMPCLALPMNTHTAIENKFSIGRAFDVYFDDATDVQPGDQLIWNSRLLTVKVVQPYEVANNAHMRCMTEQEIA